MRRTPLKPGKGFARKAPPANQDGPQRVKTLPVVPEVPPPAPRASMGPAELTPAPKTAAVRSQKILDSARGERCTLRLPMVCRGGTETTVFAHSNRSADGKGGHRKADDDRGCYACFACHAVYDRQAPRPSGLALGTVEMAFTFAMAETRLILQQKGLIE